MADLWITNVRLGRAHALTDLVILDGRVVSIGAPPVDWVGPTIDARGQLAIPGLIDGHAHVDKTLWGLPWRSHTGGDTLASLIENGRVARAELPPTAERAAAIFETYVANGTSMIRTHVDVDLDNGVDDVAAVAEVAARFGDRLDVEIVAFPQSGMLVAPGVADLLDASIGAGASLIGGIDPAGFDGDPVKHLDTIFAIADRHGCGVDLHLHDEGTLGRWEMGLVVERTKALSLQGKVTVSHAFCLCDGDPSIDPLLEQIAEQRIGLATVAPNTVEPLPFTRIVELGIGLCLGQDGVCDLWSPWGDGDMLARAGLMAWRSDFRHDHDIEFCLEIATTRGAAALGITDHGLHIGGRGDLVILDAVHPAAAAARHPPRSMVIKRGLVVVDNSR